MASVKVAKISGEKCTIVTTTERILYILRVHQIILQLMQITQEYCSVRYISRQASIIILQRKVSAHLRYLKKGVEKESGVGVKWE